jgi:hypothetical protein
VTGYQWYRNGVAIKGATAGAYKLKAADLGKGISLVAFAAADGAPAQLAAPAVNIPKAKPAITAKAAKKGIAPGGRIKVKVSVKVPGVAGPAGTILVRYGKAGAFKTKAVAIKAAKRGKTTITLPKCAKGKYTVSVGWRASHAYAAVKNAAKPKPVKPRAFSVTVR